jgi:hypothetical protein
VTPDEFVAAVETVVYSAAVRGTLAGLRDGPAGREPGARASALHDWYEALDATDQELVAEAVREAAHAAVFGFLCALDGVVAIDDPPHTDMRLTAVDPSGTVTVLNDPSTDEHLHDKFNSLVHPPSEPWPPRRLDEA